MKKLITILLSLLFFSSSLLATAKTLPKGVFKLDTYYNYYDIETVGANPSGDKVTWETITLTEGKMKDIYLFTYLDAAYNAAGSDINTEALLVNSWEKIKYHADIAYGITDKLTIFANISHEQSLLDYTDEYVEQSEIVENVLDSVSYKQAPDKAESDHINDIFVGLKYRFGPFAAAFKMSSGLLLTGIDSEEKAYADGIQELETSRGYSQHHYYLFYDNSFLIPFEFTAGYIYYGKMTQTFLDNLNVDFHAGPLTLAKLNIPLKLLDNVTLNSSLTALSHATDRYKGGNSEFGSANTDTTAGYDDWTDAPNSDGTVILTKIELIYQPAIFLRAFVNTTITLENDKAGPLYNFPGRLEPGNMVAFGVTLFAK